MLISGKKIHTRFLLLIMLTSNLFIWNISCKKESNAYVGLSESAIPSLDSVSFLLQDNPSQLTNNLSCTNIGDTFRSYYPLNAIPEKLVAKLYLNTSNLQIDVNGKTISNTSEINADFSKPVTIVISNDSISKSYTIVLTHFTGLPIIYINTTGDASINSKEDSITGTVLIDSNNVNLKSFSGNAYFFLHGNMTSSYPKSPYKMVLVDKNPILGMNSAKNWILLANYDDKTLLRNYIALQMGRMFGMQWTPSSQFVELVLNGNYVGNYELTEEVQVEKDRLNINEMSVSDNTGKNLTGGYLLEADNKMEDVDHVRFNTNSQNNSFIIHSPENITPEQLNYINNYIDSAETVLYGNGFTDSVSGYRKYIDPTSFAAYFWINELSRNNDAVFWSSSYMYKDRDSLLKMGPIWDFDIAFGNTTFNNNYVSTGWYMVNSTWFSRLLQDPFFKNIILAKWHEERSRLDSLNIMIDAMSNNISESQKQNFIVWPILNTIIYNAEPQVYGSYNAEVENLKQWITQRLAWIDNNFNTLQL